MMTWSRRLGLILCFLSGHAVAANQCPDPQDTRCKSLPGNAVQWTIHEPDVRLESLKDYPDIRFEKGQTVMVYADGCVNVSKDENRPLWKEYMEPTGGGIDRHYHGLIWIPGARVVKNGQHLAIPVGTTPVRIGSVAGRKGKTDPVELIIDDPPPGVNPTLRLGYEEAGDHRFSCLPQGTCPAMYPQHPYDPPVPGAGQCKSKATVIVEIYSGPPPQGEPPDHLKPFDVVSSEVDENGFLFAPHWNNVVSSNAVTDMGVSEECNNFPYKHWYLVRRGIDSQCSQQTSFDVPKTFTECLLAPGFGELHGHVNWAPATFVGKLSFVEVSADKDVDMQLKTIGDRVLRFPGNKDFGKIAPILTKDSQESAEYRDALWLEYATYETTNYFKPPWNQIRFTSHPQDLAKLKGDLQDKTAIATGLLNLDCVHDCHTELHPVFAMAIRTESELATGIAHHDPWMIFVRNQGNQGDCSLDQHYLGRDSYTFFLPAPPGASPGMPVVENPDSAFSSNQQGLTWSMERSPEESSNGVLLHFSFTADENACESLHRGEMTHLSGLLCLNWTGPSATSPSECKAFWGDATNAKPLTSR